MMRLDALREYLRASLRIVPTVCGVAAMGAGLLIARVRMQREADTIVAAARRSVTEPVDLGVVYAEAHRVRQTLARCTAGRRPPATQR